MNCFAPVFWCHFEYTIVLCYTLNGSLKMKDYLVSSVMDSMAKLIIWIVEVYGELTKT